MAQEGNLKRKQQQWEGQLFSGTTILKIQIYSRTVKWDKQRKHNFSPRAKIQFIYTLTC